MSTDRDWMRIVANERCDECDLYASGVERIALADAFRLEVALWTGALLSWPDRVLRARPNTERWSALELGAHVRDVLRIFGDRIDLALHQPNPEFGWWDHEDAAVSLAYNDQPPDQVVARISGNAERLATIIALLEEDAWLRTGSRREGELFTVDGLSRFALHESVHHRRDAERAISAAT